MFDELKLEVEKLSQFTDFTSGKQKTDARKVLQNVKNLAQKARNEVLKTYKDSKK